MKSIDKNEERSCCCCGRTGAQEIRVMSRSGSLHAVSYQCAACYEMFRRELSARMRVQEITIDESAAMRGKA